MAVDQHGPAQAAPDEQAGLAHLIDDRRHRYLRAEVIAGDRDRHAVRVEPGRHMTELRWLERAPIAAMDEQGERSGPVYGPQQVDRLPRDRAVFESRFGALFRAGLLPIGAD